MPFLFRIKLMGGLAFGTFRLTDGHGDVIGTVVIAPEHILLQRSRSSAIHDLSYLVVWTAARIGRLRHELAELRTLGETALEGRAPEVLTILRAIDPTARAVCCRVGECGRALARRHLKAALQISDGKAAGAAS
jgi:hypothetical protein